MSEERCSSKLSERYVNDLFELLEIRGDNQALFDELCKLLVRFPENTVKASWREIVFSCGLPNGQLAGTLPKLDVIQGILRSKSLAGFNTQHKLNKSEVISSGVFAKLWELGKEYSDGKISKGQLSREVEKLK